jgi:hypothetical protein
MFNMDGRSGWTAVEEHLMTVATDQETRARTSRLWRPFKEAITGQD